MALIQERNFIPYTCKVFLFCNGFDFPKRIDDSYSLKFKVIPNSFNGQLCIYGYTTADNPQAGICVSITSSSIQINDGSGTQTFNVGESYGLEVGFVNLFNGNTVYVFVKVNGKFVVWELVEAYQKTPGKRAIASKNINDEIDLW